MRANKPFLLGGAMKKNDKVIGVCESYTYDGMGVVKIDGFPLFVKGLLLEETAEIVVTMVKKNFGYGKYLSIKEMSPDRVTPKCPIANRCGGCQLQHMSPAHQAQFKKDQVEAVMRRIAKITTPVEAVLTMKEPFYYRNKAQIPVGLDKGKVITGFYRINSNTIIDMEECYIQHHRINEVLQCAKAQLAYDQDIENYRHLLIKYGIHSDEVMVVFIVKEYKETQLAPLVEVLTQTIPQIKSIQCNINTRNDNVILGEEEVLLYGEQIIHDSIHGLSFEISMKSFYQVNPIQTDVLYQTALAFAMLTGHEEVLDLYCGVGTIGMFMAKHAKHVTGIEIVAPAIQNAKENAKRNHIENIEFICADASDYAKECSENNKKVDVIVVDPPRKGCDAGTLESMVQMNPARIVYVSCKVSTLARDLRILEDLGYHTTKLQPVDMFPQTYGIECVALLERSLDA